MRKLLSPFSTMACDAWVAPEAYGWAQHAGGFAENHDVLQRCQRALTPGEGIIVSELPYPDSPGEYRTNPVYKALAGIQIHEAQVGFGAITQNELRSLFADAGFRNPRVAVQPMPTRFVMIAEKRALPHLESAMWAALSP